MFELLNRIVCNPPQKKPKKRVFRRKKTVVFRKCEFEFDGNILSLKKLWSFAPETL